jgi:hypothetical protein
MISIPLVRPNAMNEHLTERFGHGPPGQTKQRQQQQQRQRQYREDVAERDQVEVIFLPPRLNTSILKYENDHKVATDGPEWLNIQEIPDAAELAYDGPRDLPCNRPEGPWSTKGKLALFLF